MSIKYKSKGSSNFKSDSNVAIFNTGFFSFANFDGTALAEDLEVTISGEDVTVDTSSKDTWNALVAVEGSFRDSKDKPHDFSVDRLGQIAVNTNKVLNSGTDIPVCTDHKKTIENTVGKIKGEAFIRPIGEKDLPNAKATHLLGKMGLFVSGVNIKVPEALEKVRNGVVTSVSMGLDLVKNSLVELSLVTIPAIPNMGLFSKADFNLTQSNLNQNAISWEELEYSEQSLEVLKKDYDILTDNLWSLLNNLYNSDELDIQDVASLKQYIYTTLNGFSVRMIELLGLNDLEDTQAAPDNTGATLSAEEQAQMQMQQAQGVSQPSQEQQGVYSRSSTNVSYFSKYKRIK